jgi:hypothetical protein
METPVTRIEIIRTQCANSEIRFHRRRRLRAGRIMSRTPDVTAQCYSCLTPGRASAGRGRWHGRRLLQRAGWDLSPCEPSLNMLDE